MTKAQDPFVDFFRSSAPYIHAHRGRVMVLCFGGEAVVSRAFNELVHDIALLHSLGLRLVLVHGARPQIEARLREAGQAVEYVDGLRVTDDLALRAVKEAVASVRVEIEARLSMGVANSPMAGARIRVAGGNFVVAQPIGVVDGVDYVHTGEVRRVDADAIRQRLDSGAIAILSPLGYSITGEVFNVGALDVAAAAARALRADKLVYMVEGRGVVDSHRRVVNDLTPDEADELLLRRKRMPADLRRSLRASVQACRGGVRRAHLLDRRVDGVLLRELFTRDGLGTLVTAETYEGVRSATLNDVNGILELIEPLAEQGVLVRRQRELVETQIDRFTVIERDGLVIACAALHPFEERRIAEVSTVAVDPRYRATGRGDTLLGYLERRAREQGIERLFVLTTRTAHWFRERGFEPGRMRDLPERRRRLQNPTRNSKVFVKVL